MFGERLRRQAENRNTLVECPKERKLRLILLKIEGNVYWAWTSVKLLNLNNPTTIFDGFRVRREVKIAEFGNILAAEVVVCRSGEVSWRPKRVSRCSGINFLSSDMSFWEALGGQTGVNFVKNRTQCLLGVDFRQISEFERPHHVF